MGKRGRINNEFSDRGPGGGGGGTRLSNGRGVPLGG